MPAKKLADSISAFSNYSGTPIQEAVINGFFTVDEQWIVQTWNKAAEQILGFSASAIIGKNIWEQFGAVLPLNFYVVYQNAFLPDMPHRFVEYWPEKKSWFDVVTYHSDHKLSVSFKLVVPMPQTYELGQPAQQLKILNDLYRYVTEVTNDCLWEWNLADKQIFWIDGSHKRIFGYPIENALVPQEFWESRIHPEDKQQMLENLHQLITIGKTKRWEAEYRFQRADGSYANVCDRGHLMFDNTAKPVRMIGATEDITRRKFTELQLIASEKKLALIARQMINAVITTDVEGKITWVNKAFTDITGYNSEEAIGRKPGSFLQGKDTDPKTIIYLREKILANETFDCNILNYTRSGRPFWSHLSGQPLFDQTGKLERYFAMETDVTEKKEAEARLAMEHRFRQKELEQAVLAGQERERSKIGMELHDNINQILGAAKLYIDLSRSDQLNKDEYLDKASDYLEDVIRDIRKISKTLVTPVLLMGLVDSLAILLEDLESISNLQIEYINDFVEAKLLPQLQLDIFRIIQEQLNNVITHAFATQVTVSLISRKHKLELLVSDNGKGCVCTETGKGVGLINIRTRASIHDAEVNIVSSPGQGFELQVLFPLQNRIKSK
jgi:PAS domain S-box-containing protein